MGAFTYPRSEPGSGGHQDLIETLNATIPKLREAVAGLPDAALNHRPSGDEWSIKEVCGHLCDHARFLRQRLAAMIALEEPELAAWDQDEQLRARDARSGAIEGLLAEFSSQRAGTVDMLAELVHWNWARTGRHTQFGRISIRQLVDRAIAHDAAHLDQLHALTDRTHAETRI